MKHSDSKTLLFVRLAFFLNHLNGVRYLAVRSGCIYRNPLNTTLQCILVS